MEIERKYLLKTLPYELGCIDFSQIEQVYISTSPVIRIRKKDAKFFLTCKSKGMMAREEFEIEISEQEFGHLKTKAEGNVIVKKRYYFSVDHGLVIELDVFEGHLEGLVMAEVEFPSLEAANSFLPPSWFAVEVTTDHRFHNSSLSQVNNIDHLRDLIRE